MGVAKKSQKAEESISQLARKSRSVDHVERQLAVRALGETGRREAIGPLVSALKDQISGVVVEAARALAKIPGKRAVLPLCEAMGRDTWGTISLACTEALGQIGDVGAVDALLESLRFKNALSTGHFERAVLRIGRQAEPKLLERIDDGLWYVRYGAARALGIVGSSQAVDPLIAALEDGRSEVRIGAAWALGQLEAEEAIAPLLAAGKRTTRMLNLRRYAEALDAIGWRPAGPRDKMGQVLLIARGEWDALAAMGPPAVPTLRQAVRDESVQVRVGAIETLGRIGDPRAVAPLVACLRGKHILRIKAAAAAALGDLGHRSACAPLIRFLGTKVADWHRPQQAAAESLAKLADPVAVEPLIEAMQTSMHAQVRVAAAAALASWNRQGIVQALERALKDEDLDLRKAAAISLERLMGAPKSLTARVHTLMAQDDYGAIVALGKAAVQPLLETLADEPESEQRKIIRALGRIADLKTVGAVIDWLFERPLLFGKPADLNPWVTDLSGLFGDYCRVLLKAAGYVKKTSETEESGSYGSEGETKYHYGLTGSDRAIAELCKRQTAIVTNLLWKVAAKEDVEVESSYSWNEWGCGSSMELLSFEGQRARARRELARRGDPESRPSAYLERRSWCS